jgi:hypothetical protein
VNIHLPVTGIPVPFKEVMTLSLVMPLALVMK